MRRIYHPFWTWEDIGMWRDVSAKDCRAMLEPAIRFTGDARAYGAAMLRVLDECPLACEHNLTERSMNQQAWIGHAAAYLAHGFPEYLTREAWGLLTQQQRDEANAMADRAINEWKQRTASEDRRLHPQMEITGVP